MPANVAAGAAALATIGRTMAAVGAAKAAGAIAIVVAGAKIRDPGADAKPRVHGVTAAAVAGKIAAAKAGAAVGMIAAAKASVAAAGMAAAIKVVTRAGAAVVVTAAAGQAGAAKADAAIKAAGAVAVAAAGVIMMIAVAPDAIALVDDSCEFCLSKTMPICSAC
jgi:hypothetical protein